jgi:Uma2 family endonuclease
MSAPPKKRHTPEEYLALERESDVKHEYLDGDIYAMAGAKPNHNLITANTTISLGTCRHISPRHL